jgi:RNA polymerase sigma factor for flagellar operon FliA
LVDELRTTDRASRCVRGRAREIEAVRASLTAVLGRSARPEDLANALGVTAADLSSIDADLQRANLLCLQSLAPETGAALVPDGQRGPEQLLLDREQIGYLLDAI